MEIRAIAVNMQKCMCTFVCKNAIVLLFLFSTNSIYSQSADVTIDNNAQMVLESLNLSPELEKRVNGALMTYEKMVQVGRYINSIAELINDKDILLPIGLKSKEYTICIDEIYEDSVVGEQSIYIKAICVIPTLRGQSLAFEGVAKIEGENGVGTNGRLELIAPIEKKLGSESSLIFREGSTLTFGCNGFREVEANVAYILKSDKIYGVDSDGKNLGKLMFEGQARFSNINDFTITTKVSKDFCFVGLEGFVFSINNIIIDHSIYTTPPTAKFSQNYFAGADTNASYKNWQGLAITNAIVTLPNYMLGDTNMAAKKISLQLDNVIIDGNGFSGKVEAKEVISSNSIDPHLWAISINSFNLAINRNFIVGVGFKGKVNIPPLGKSSMLDYEAIYDNEQQTFVLQSSLGKSLDFPMLCAKLSLDDNSTISFKTTNKGIYPTINANGFLTVEAPIGKDTVNSKLILPDIRFERMVIGRDQFDIGIFSLTGKFKTPSIAGFNLTLSDIKTINDTDGVGFSIEAAVAVNEMFNGRTKIALYGNNKTWKFNKVKTDKVQIDYKSNAFAINGNVEFRDGDAIYGNGFRGDLDLELINKFNVRAVGIFGCKDNYRYFFTDLFYETQPSSGIQVPPALSFYGFGGGLYNHMRQNISNSQSEFGKSLSGISYLPDKNVGMGFMARTKFGLIGTSSLFDADVNFEMQFNRNWGVNFVQLRGEATMLSLPQQTSMLENLKKSLKTVEKQSAEIVKFDKSSLDIKPQKKGALTATIGMNFDIENDVFTADMRAYLDVADVLKGSGANNSVGWANAYFAKDKWYTYIGTPNERFGVSLLGIANADGYFMTGNDVPELPSIPNKVRSSLSLDYINTLERRVDGSKLMEGKGLAFGTDLSVKFNAELIPFYARLGVGMGTEMLLKQYSVPLYCSGRTGQIGVDGWYAQAQAWAWVDATIGMEVKLFQKKRKFDILSAEMASYLKGAGPNPTYFTGSVGGKFNILGGLVKGHCNFDFTVGEKCEIIGGSPFGEDVIAQLTPINNSNEVNVFVAPQLILNIPAEENMKIDEENGKKETYRVRIADFYVLDIKTNIKMQYVATKSEDNRIWTYELDEPLENHKQYQVYAKVVFERLNGNTWISVSGDDGKPYCEEKTIRFTSGERPKYILPEHVVYAYPADRQYNFLINEYESAYVMTSKDYSYLFTSDKPDGYDQKVQFTTFEGKSIETSFTYKTVSNTKGVKFEISMPIANIGLSTNQIYNMAIVNTPQHTTIINENITEKVNKLETTNGSDVTKTEHEAVGNLEMLEQTEIYAIDFRTSSYKTFEEKMKNMKYKNIITSQMYGPVFILQTDIIDSSTNVESFDYYEYRKEDISKSLIRIFPDYDNNSWFVHRLYPLMYKDASIISIVGNYLSLYEHRDVIEWNILNLNSKLSSESVKTNLLHAVPMNSYLLDYSMKFVNEDFYSIKTELANYILNKGVYTSSIKNILNMDQIPNLVYGNYPLEFQYILPGKNKKSIYLFNSQIKQ